MVLSIVEVSQKQAYIFSSNLLKDNVSRSAEIAWVTSSAFFEKCCRGLYEEKENLVYAGGGHTVLCFENMDSAKAFNEKLTYTVLTDFPDMEIFVKVSEYNKELSHSENLKELTRKLEEKKSVRRAAFHQGTFGLEAMDQDFRPKRKNAEEIENRWKNDIDKAELEIDKNILTTGYKNVSKFEELTVTGGKTNFLAVVHIDGNGMGARINRLYEKLEKENLSWEEFKNKIQEYSDLIDVDFKRAYSEMLDEIVRSDIMKDNTKLPIRRVITSGDDICFAADGKLGIEAARIYLQKLSAKKNDIDGEGYAACAGVSITHIKYPFFRSYELAEALCSNAKRAGAMKSPENNGSDASLLDWHICFGELKNTLEEERREYISQSGDKLMARPYIIDGLVADKDIKAYEEFKQVLKDVLDSEKTAVRSKIKGIRNILKRSEEEIAYYRDFYHLEKVFNNDKGVLFDAIEIMDLFEEI